MHECGATQRECVTHRCSEPSRRLGVALPPIRVCRSDGSPRPASPAPEPPRGRRLPTSRWRRRPRRNGRRRRRSSALEGEVACRLTSLQRSRRVARASGGVPVVGGGREVALAISVDAVVEREGQAVMDVHLAGPAQRAERGVAVEVVRGGVDDVRLLGALDDEARRPTVRRWHPGSSWSRCRARAVSVDTSQPPGAAAITERRLPALRAHERDPTDQNVVDLGWQAAVEFVERPVRRLAWSSVFDSSATNSGLPPLTAATALANGGANRSADDGRHERGDVAVGQSVADLTSRDARTDAVRRGSTAAGGPAPTSSGRYAEDHQDPGAAPMWRRTWASRPRDSGSAQCASSSSSTSGWSPGRRLQTGG